MTTRKNEYENLVGKRVRLILMQDPYTTLKPGDLGIVTSIDGFGSIHVQWDNGSTLALIPGVDKWELITR
jgi:hypothetical protein